MIAMTVAWTVAFFFANLLQCLPLSVNWSALGYTPEACVRTDLMYIAQGYSDILTDCKTWRKGGSYILAANTNISQC